MRKSLIRFVLCVAVIFVAIPAHAGIIEFLFPTLKSNEPDPSQTLVAPFAEQKPPPAAQPQPGAVPAPPQAAEVVPLPENHVPLDTAHRNNEQIADWLIMVASEALTFEADNYQQTLDGTAKYFNDAGRQQYLAFLEANSLTKVLQANKYYVRSFVQETPILLNEGAIEGRYRWLYEVPVMISYMDRNMRGYKNAQPVNQTVTLKIQVGRTQDSAETGKDIILESWTGKTGTVARQ